MVLIPNTKHFFISLRDHPEYGAAHTVFGEVSDSHAAVPPFIGSTACHHLLTYATIRTLDYGRVFRPCGIDDREKGFYLDGVGGEFNNFLFGREGAEEAKGADSD